MMSEWIRADERLPVEDGQLLVVFDPNNDPQVWPGRWSRKYRNFESMGGWFEPDEVTHWMPLPKHPENQ